MFLFLNYTGVALCDSLFKGPCLVLYKHPPFNRQEKHIYTIMKQT